jgi:hypothetical protein
MAPLFDLGPAEKTAPATGQLRSDPGAPTSWGTLPLVAFNRAFDVFLMPWGHAGQWLRGRAGRNVLGAVGVVCLIAAAVLVVADGIGWAR